MSSSKRHFIAVIGKKEHGSYVSSSPSSAARKAVSNYLLVTLFKKSKSEIEPGNLSAENVEQEKESIKAKIQAKIDEL